MYVIHTKDSLIQRPRTPPNTAQVNICRPILKAAYGGVLSPQMQHLGHTHIAVVTVKSCTNIDARGSPPSRKGADDFVILFYTYIYVFAYGFARALSLCMRSGLFIRWASSLVINSQVTLITPRVNEGFQFMNKHVSRHVSRGVIGFSRCASFMPLSLLKAHIVLHAARLTSARVNFEQ